MQSSSRRTSVRAWWALCCVAVGVLAGCSRSQPQPASALVVQEDAPSEAEAPPFELPVVPPRPSEAYVGSQACVECHAEISETFHAHPMGHSLAKVHEAAPLEDYKTNNRFDVPPPPRSRTSMSYWIERDGESVVHHEVLKSKDGELVYDHGVPVHYAVGSGQRGRSYITNRDGLLFMSPVTWYSGSQRWDLSPGYELNNLHFGRRIVDGCVNCHAGRIADVTESPNRFEADPFLEESIGCERCHGPGREHVEHWRLGDQSGPDPIVNPIDLPPRQRDHVCLQCHLIGEHRLTRYGRSEFDFRPGDEIEDIWTVFLKGTGIEDDHTTAAVNQAEQMMSSACYRLSEGRLGCVSCHDPHATPQPEERVAFYRGRCLECHTSSGSECSKPVDERLAVSAEDSCIACHMPAVAANDVPHTSQTDHRILKEYAATVASTNEPPGLHIFGATGGIISDAELDRAQALYLVRMSEDSGSSVFAAEAIPFLEPWVKVVPDDVDAQEALGMAYWLVRETRKASDVWEQALERHPRHEHLLRRMMVLCQETEQPELGVRYGQRLVEVNAWDFEYFGRLAHMLGQLGRFDEAIAAGERALELNPAERRIHAWLAEIYALRGDVERSHEHRRKYAAQAP